MKKYFLIFFMGISFISRCQQKIEIGISGLCGFPVSDFKFSRNISLDQNGGVIRPGAGCDIFLIHHPLKHIFYGIDWGYSSYRVDYTNLFYRLDYFINNSQHPERYASSKVYFYYASGSKWQSIDLNFPLGFNIVVRKFCFTVSVKLGIAVVLPPIVSISAYKTDSIGVPHQSIEFVSVIDNFKSNALVLFGYGCDFKIGYVVYKQLHIFSGFTYTGTTNANVEYFKNPPYGYKKTIQTVGVTLGLSYELPLKEKRKKGDFILWSVLSPYHALGQNRK